MGGIGGVTVDARGRVYVLDSYIARVERFTPGGEFQTAFGSLGSAPGELNPGINGGLALLGDDLYVGDQDNHRVQRFHLGVDGRPEGAPLVFGGLGTGPGQFDYVAGLAVDPARDHAVFVADDRNDRIQRFSRDGAFEAIVGTNGTGPGQFRNPYDAGVDLAGRLFVADDQNHRIARLDAGTLAFASSFGGPGRLNNVRGIVVSPRGACSPPTRRSTKSRSSRPTGAFVRSFGRDGRGPTAFMQPREVAVAPDGVVVVADTRADRVQVLRADGRVDTWARISTTLGTPASGMRPREFRDPTAVAVDPRNGDVWVAEGGGHRVQRIPLDGTVAGIQTFGGPDASSAQGRLLVADTYANRVVRFQAPAVPEPAEAGGTVAPTLALELGAGGRFEPFTPGVAHTDTTTLAADVLSSGGDAALTVTDPGTVAPGRLVNGAYALAAPLLVAGSPLPAVAKTWAAPVAHDPIAIALAQTIGANEPLRTPTYAKILTFTLSTTQP